MAHLYYENYMRRLSNVNVPIINSPSSANASGTNRRQIPHKMGYDRFIPVRDSKQMEVAGFLLKRKNEPEGSSSEREKAWSMALNGFNIEDAKILNIGGKWRNTSEGHLPATRYVSPTPDTVLDAPQLHNDFYLNILDWSSHNMLTVALHNKVYLWDATQEKHVSHMMTDSDENYICSLSWTKDGNHLAVGTSNCTVQLWDVELQRCLRTMVSHTSRVGSLSWNESILSSGSRSGHIHHHDVRMARSLVSILAGHTREVCGLKWSTDGQYLASGGDDNVVHVWPRVQDGGAGNESQSIYCWREHQGAVKALAWCPWQPNHLVTGGGADDRCIRIWSVNNGSCMSSLETQSQISSLVFSPNYRELVSANGCEENNIVIRQYPSLTEVGALSSDQSRVLSLVLSPDKSTIAAVAADERVRLWKSFKFRRELQAGRLDDQWASLINPMW